MTANSETAERWRIVHRAQVIWEQETFEAAARAIFAGYRAVLEDGDSAQLERCTVSRSPWEQIA